MKVLTFASLMALASSTALGKLSVKRAVKELDTPKSSSAQIDSGRTITAYSNVSSAVAVKTGRTTAEQALPGAQVLATGTCQKSGEFTDQLEWQATGVLSSASSCKAIGVSIDTCYMIYMAPTGMLEGASCSNSKISRRSSEEKLERRIINVDSSASSEMADTEVAQDVRSTNAAFNTIEKRSSPRQRTELLSWPPAEKNDHYRYQWKSYLKPGVTTNDHFYHMTQVIAREDIQGPVITLDAKDGVVKIVDNVRKCDPCDSVDLGEYTGRTLTHDLEVIYGDAGLFNYIIHDTRTGEKVLSYIVHGRMGGRGSVKFGTYRMYEDNLSESISYYGDFQQSKL